MPPVFFHALGIAATLLAGLGLLRLAPHLQRRWMRRRERRRAAERFGQSVSLFELRSEPERLEVLRPHVVKVGFVVVETLSAPSAEGCRPPPSRPGRSSATAHRSGTVFVVDRDGELWDLASSDLPDYAAVETLREDARWLAGVLGVPCDVG